MRKIRRIIAVLFVCMLCFSLLAGCSGGSGGGKEADGKGSGTRTVKDDRGVELTLPEKLESIAIVGPVFPSIVYAIQGHLENVKAVAKSAYTGWQLSIMKDLAPEFENVDTTIFGKEINFEELANLNPDLVIDWTTDTEDIAKMEEMGITVAAFTAAKDIETLRHLLGSLAAVLGCEDRYEVLMKYYDEMENYINSKQTQIAALSEDEKPRVLFLRNTDLDCYTDGVNPYIAEWVGAQNIVMSTYTNDTTTGDQKPTMEAILAYNPQIILLSNFDDFVPEDFYNNTIEAQDWSNVDAVKNHRVYKIPCGLYRWVPPNCAEKFLFCYYVASIVQPEIFSEIDMEKTIKEFFADYFSYDLTQDQVDFIVHKEANADSV